nr:MAG TPA: hypothetical protein [Bacteriophage sp.]
MLLSLTKSILPPLRHFFILPPFLSSCTSNYALVLED